MHGPGEGIPLGHSLGGLSWTATLACLCGVSVCRPVNRITDMLTAMVAWCGGERLVSSFLAGG